MSTTEPLRVKKQRAYASSQRICGVMILCARLVQEQIATRIAPYGITYAQAAAMIPLWRNPQHELPQAELVQLLVLSPASATLLFNQLHRRGLVERRADPEDGRRQTVRLTAIGLALEDPVLSAFDETEEILRAALAPETINTYFDALFTSMQRLREVRRDRTLKLTEGIMQPMVAGHGSNAGTSPTHQS